jgi:hypothetical protein
MMLTPKEDLDTKLDDNPHKLAKKNRISTIKVQVDDDVKILNFLNI